jgi:L1 cell adhesion molecule like protein
MRNTLKDTNIAAKIDASDKERLEKMVEDAIEWLDHNQARPHLEFVR